ncbi:hypothetical protein [Acinetobacter sp. YH12039]|uniref:hypothetical protein n=1 Tax=Acinetobacter sp. YH12039 TaxID=2601047 RepID=UPI0015D32A00|nr:hypothetical protein [Acinetobacter sp. YH12039]
MKERPILFSAPMVSAILEGRKTQTRRIMRRQPDDVERFHRGETTTDTDASHAILRCYNNPKGFKKCASGWFAGATYKTPFSEFNVGDRLWVRENFMDLSGTGVEHRNSSGKLQKYAYAADCPRGSHSDELRKDFGLKWKPSIHMPRSASRILLEITKIRVERLTDISTEDAKAEGFDYSTHPSAIKMGYAIGAKTNFRHAWQEIYGATSWDKNPWVWVVEFKVIQGGET